MTPEVKKRIEQIRQGIVPEGYKKTKTDIVPADWNESPIGEYICEYTEKTTIPNQYPVLTSARTGLMLQTDYYSNRQVTTDDNVGYNILPYGYITFRSRSDDGHFRFNENRIIERGIISYFYPVFSFSEKVCHEYMLYLLNFSIYRRMYPYAEGTAQQVLSLKKLGQLKYSFPPVREQKKIAEILSTQDKAIELQARKIEELKRFKRGCLEKMFPRNGQKVPEKRFPGFTGDWEQRKFSELAETRRGLTYNPSSIRDSGIRVLRSSNIVEDQFLYSNEDVFVEPSAVNIPYASKGDILITSANGSTRLVGKHAIIREIPEKSAVHGGFMLLVTASNPEFVNALMSAPWYSQFIALYVSGGNGSIGNLNKGDLDEQEVFVSTDAEQKIIGKYFKGIDNLITLHQRKLEAMKKQKKALMQLLLTGIVRV